MNQFGPALCLGLLEIGKPWGYRPSGIPTDAETQRFLESAWNIGIRDFDTAASYGSSEERFGRFLQSLTGSERAEAFVATKFGEHWNPERGEPFVDHSYDALAASLDRSLERLGAIDLLQLHKTTPDVLRSPDLERAWSYARNCGVKALGASVKDHESARLAIAASIYDAIQLPFNRQDTQFEDLLGEATAASVKVLVNRPLRMGRLLYESGSTDQRSALVEAFRFILQRRFAGWVIVGTRSAEHLAEDFSAFQEATNRLA